MLVLASEVEKPEVSSLDTAGWQCQLPGCSVTAAETFVEDSVEETLSSVLLNKPSSTPEAERELSGNNHCLAFSHQLLEISHIHTAVIGFTSDFTSDHCTFLAADGWFPYSSHVVAWLNWYFDTRWNTVKQIHFLCWIIKMQTFGIPAVNVEYLIFHQKSCCSNCH